MTGPVPMRSAPYRGAVCRNGDGRPAHALGVCRRCYERSRVAGVYLGRGPSSPGASDWMAAAVCRRPGADPNAWFPDDEDAAGWAAARAACDGCPVRARCLSWALSIGEVRWGVWGGATPRERRAMTRVEVA